MEHAVDGAGNLEQQGHSDRSADSVAQPMREMSDSGPVLDNKVPRSVKSAARALRLLEVFDEIRRPARAMELARRVGIPRSSTSVMLNSLVRLGYLEYDQLSRSYLPSLRTALLGTWREDGYFRNGSVQSLLEGVRADTGMSVGLASLNGIFVRYFQVLNAGTEEKDEVSYAMNLYAVWSAVGIVLLADATPSELRALVHRTHAEDHPTVKALTFGQVEAWVEQARQQGYFASKGLISRDAGAISICLPKSVTQHWPSVALTVFGTLDEIVRREEEIFRIMTARVEEMVTAGARR